MPDADRQRIAARRELIKDSKAEVDEERIHSQRHEDDLSERMLSQWPAYSGSTKFGPVTGSTYGGGGGMWSRRYYGVAVKLVLYISALLGAMLTILVLTGILAI